MHDRCITCGFEDRLLEENKLTLCWTCLFTHKKAINAPSFVDNIIKEKEQRLEKMRSHYLSGFHRDYYRRKMPEEVRILLEEIHFLKKHNLVRLNYIFETKKDEW